MSMVLDIWSPFRFCSALEDSQGRMFLTDRVPFYYQNLPDNIEHVIVQGDTPRKLAAQYYSSLEYAAELAPFIADFQVDEATGEPAPIRDETIALTPGRRLWIPSLETVLAVILSEERRAEHDV